MTPRLAGIRERFDTPLYDTHQLAPGQSLRFFELCDTGDLSQTNMEHMGYLPGEHSYTIGAVGLRIMCTAREIEDRLLDLFTVRLTVGRRVFLTAPGNLLSTFRLLHQDDEEYFEQLVRHETASSEELELLKRKPRDAWYYFPGYVLARPVIIPVKQRFDLEVTAAAELAEPLRVRGFLFGLTNRDLG